MTDTASPSDGPRDPLSRLAAADRLARAARRRWPGSRIVARGALESPAAGFYCDVARDRRVTVDDVLALQEIIDASDHSARGTRPPPIGLVPESEDVSDGEGGRAWRIVGLTCRDPSQLRRAVARYEAAVELEHRTVGRSLRLLSFPRGGEEPIWSSEGRVLRDLVKAAARSAYLACGSLDVAGRRGLRARSTRLRETAGDQAPPAPRAPLRRTHSLESWSPASPPPRGGGERSPGDERIARMPLTGLRAAREVTRDTFRIMGSDPGAVAREVRDGLGRAVDLHGQLGVPVRAVWIPSARRGPLDRRDVGGEPHVEWLDEDSPPGRFPRVELRTRDVHGAWIHVSGWIEVQEPVPRDRDPHGADALQIEGSLLGTVESAVAALLEESRGRLHPRWAPVQVRLLCVSPETEAAADRAGEALAGAGIRWTVDRRHDRLPTKLRDAQVLRAPLTLVVDHAPARSPRIRRVLRWDREVGGETTVEEVARWCAAQSNPSEGILPT